MSSSAPEAQNPMLDAALDYARRGWPVVPVWWPVNGGCSCGEQCDKPGKHPIADLVEHGVSQASTNEELIRRWITKFPEMNIGIRVGERRVVLDFDSSEALARFEAEIPQPLPETLIIQTGRGVHVWLLLPEGIEIQSDHNALGKGIDIKTGNSYVVAPPALHFSGRRYFWISGPDAPIAPCPAWLLERLTRKPGRSELRAGINPAEVLRGVPEGSRDKTLFDYARDLRARGGFSKAEAEALVLLAASRCTPPFNLRLAAEKVERRWERPENEARAEIQAEARGETEIAPPDAPRLTISWDEFMAETYPPVSSLCGDAFLVRSGGYLLLAGDTGVGKTILKANLILSLAEGRDEFLGFALPGRPVRCLLLEAEGSRQRFRDRLRQIAEARAIRGSLPIFFHERNAELAISNLGPMIEETGAEYVFLDAIGRFWSGNENDATEWRAGVTVPLQKLAVAYNVAISFNDHPVKPSENRQGQHKVRGSAAKIQDCGAAMRLEWGKAGKASRILFFDRVRDGALPFPDRDPSRIPLLIDVDAGTIVLDEREDADLGTTPDIRLADVARLCEKLSGQSSLGKVSTAALRLAVESNLDLSKSRAEDLITAAKRAGKIESAGRGYYRPPSPTAEQLPLGEPS